MESTDDMAPRTMASFAGRTISMEMGNVRMGGSGRPVMIPLPTRSNSAHGERRQPRVVLEPQPRSPFGRKLETSVGSSFPVTETTRRISTHTTVPPERVHSVHHPTHRTPMAVALRRVDSSKEVAPPKSRKRSAADTSNGVTQPPTTSRAAKSKKKGSSNTAPQSVVEDVAQLVEPQLPPRQRLADLQPEQVRLFTRDPRSIHDDIHNQQSFHIREQLARVDEEESNVPNRIPVEPSEPMSGWRAVDDSIDHIYQDPSIDMVRLQLLLHEKSRTGEKRKAIEKERLQVAAAELQKQRQGQHVKSIEFQRRREQILKMSEDIRNRNKASISKVESHPKASIGEKKKPELTKTLPTRKPPVPRLSQLGGKSKSSKPKRKTIERENLQDSSHKNETNLSSLEMLEKADPTDMHGKDEPNEYQSDNRASESILLPPVDTDSGRSTVRTTESSTRAAKKRRSNNSAVPKTTRTRPDTGPSKPPEEQLQRRAVAREYMQIQKQTRLLIRAQMKQQRQLEGERRKLELQRLEEIRLRDLEDARRRRIRQKQRERAAQRKRDEEKQNHQEDSRDDNTRALPPVDSDVSYQSVPDRTDHNDTENQSFRGNNPTRHRSGNDDFEWPGSDHDSSPDISPTMSPRAGQHDLQLKDTFEPDSKIQKLLALEDQAKMLSQKLHLLSKKNGSNAHPIDSPQRAETFLSTAVDLEIDRESSSESDASDESDGARYSHRHGRDEDDGDQVDDHHSETRIDQEDFVFFDGGFPQVADLDGEIDLSTIGVHNIQVCWPRDDDEVDHPASERFELLSSSSSSSSASCEQVEENRSSRSDHYSGFPSSKLLEESVDDYAERLLNLSSRVQAFTSIETPTSARLTRETDTISNRVAEASKILADTGRPKQTQRKKNGDDELLRLIRESDDNLSVIDREAKRRFHLQQKSLRQRQREQESLDEERLKADLDPHTPVRIDSLSSPSSVSDEMPMQSTSSSEGEPALEYEKLDEIMEAVRTKTDDINQSKGKYESSHDAIPQETSRQSTTAVEFWNSQLQPPRPVGLHDRVGRIEIDRSDLRAQEELTMEYEDEGSNSLLSPQSLAKRLLAAVEYHEAIHEAHLQLSMMEKEHALEQVQQDTIALAHAFKEEMDGTLTTQQLLAEHAALEGEFDTQLKNVVDQLESVRESERRESEIIRDHMAKEVKEARRRESGVQTEPPRQTDAAISARLGVEAASTTDKELFDAGVQHSEDFPLAAFAPVSNIVTEHATMANISENESGDDYTEETFDQISHLSPTKIRSQKDPHIEPVSHVNSMSGDADEVHSDEAASVGEGSDMNEVDEEMLSEKGATSASVKSNSIREDPSVEEAEVVSAGSSSRRHSQSISVVYDDDDFEDDTSLKPPDKMPAMDEIEVVSEVENDETAIASEEPSESESVGYEEEQFDPEPMSTSESKPRNESMGDQDTAAFVDEISEAGVSSAYSDEDESVVDKAHSVSDEASMKYSKTSHEELTPEKSERTMPRTQVEQRGRHSEDVSVAQSGAPTALTMPLTNPSALRTVSYIATVASVAPELSQSYLAQLESRKRSEEALLDIRLTALEAKLSQDLGRVMEEIAQHEHKAGAMHDVKRRDELELQKDALHMAYLSEKANIDSQRAACVSRYYQDLLALRSLGVLGNVLSTVADTVRLLPATPNSLGSVLQVPSRKDVSDEYDEDGFDASVARSSSRDDGIIEEEDSEKRSQVTDADDDDSEHDVASVVGAEDSISSVQDHNEDYGEEDFASVSESTPMDERDVHDEEVSIESTTVVADEATPAVEIEDAESNYDDEDVEEIVHASVQEESSDHQEIEVPAALKQQELPDPETPQGGENEPDEVSQVSNGEEFASMSEHAENSELSLPDAVQIGSELESSKVNVHDNDEIGSGEEASDAYDDEFASESGTAPAHDEQTISEEDDHDNLPDMNEPDISEDDIQEEALDMGEPRIEASTVDSHDEYADDEFDDTDVPPENADQRLQHDSIRPVEDASKDGEDEGEKYSDDDFETSDTRLNTASEAITHKVSDLKQAELPDPRDDNYPVQQPPSEALIQEDEYAIHEPLTVKSLSASELCESNFAPVQSNDHPAKMTGLGESVSLSLQDEDLTTASMEEQIKRIDDLKKQIDLRKEAFVTVQKKLRIEKKKEHLRAAETQLWVDMESLETQLVADERILELTRQRGQLESRELEAKHIQLLGQEPHELLADFDYCESVEPVKSPVVKQDHEVQVRLVDHSSAQANRVVVSSMSTESDHDLLLAFDHVEIAEMPVSTVATTTEVDDQLRGNEDLLFDFDHVEDAKLPVTAMATQTATGTDIKPTLIMPQVVDKADVLSDRLALEVALAETLAVNAEVKTTLDDDSIKSSEIAEVHTTDLLAAFDYVEDVEIAVSTDDLLAGFDYVENVVRTCTTYEVISTSGKRIVADSFERIHQKEANLELHTDEGRDDPGESRRSSLNSANDASCAEEHEMPPVEEDVDLVPVTQSYDSAQEFKPQVLVSEVDLVRGDHNREYEDEDKLSLYDEQTTRLECTESGEACAADEDARIESMTENLLDIRSASGRRTAHKTIHDTTDEQTDSNYSSNEIFKMTSSSTAVVNRSDHIANHNQDDVGESSASLVGEGSTTMADAHGDAEVDHHEMTPEKPLPNEHDVDSIVDRLLSDLMTKAVRDGLRLRTTTKQRDGSVSAICHDVEALNTPACNPSGHDKRVTRVETHLSIQSAIASQLRIEVDRVTLPDYHECVSGQPDTSNTRAIYDAVLNVACSVFNQLNRDPLFASESNTTSKQTTLVERVAEEINTSIWHVRERAQDELERFARQIVEEEQGDVDQDDLRLLLAQQRVGLGDSLLTRFQSTAVQRQPSSVITPRQRRRTASASMSHVRALGLGAQILEQEQSRVAERITERLMRSLAQSEIMRDSRR